MSDTVKELKRQAEQAANYMKMDYRRIKDEKDGWIGWYDLEDYTVTLDMAERKFLNQQPLNKKMILQHEQQHRLNSQNGLHDQIVSPEQYYKVCMADEISANMAELVALRHEYIKQGNIKVFDSMGGQFSFYKEAIEKGEINPHSLNPEDFKKDMTLIAQGTYNMWLENSAPLYNGEQIQGLVLDYKTECAEAGTPATRNDKNYQTCLDIAFTIGGVNFNDYFDFNRSLYCYDDRLRGSDLTADEIPAALQKEEQIRAAKRLGQIKGSNLVKACPYEGDMSLEEYKKLLQFTFLSRNTADEIKELSKYAKIPQNKLSENDKKAIEDIKKRVERQKQQLSTRASLEQEIANAVWYAQKTKGNSPGNAQTYQQKVRDLLTAGASDKEGVLKLLGMGADTPMPFDQVPVETIVQHIDEKHRSEIQSAKEDLQIRAQKNPTLAAANNNGRVIREIDRTPQYQPKDKVRTTKVLDMAKAVIQNPSTQNLAEQIKQLRGQNNRGIAARFYKQRENAYAR